MWNALNAEDATGKVLSSYSEVAIKQIKGTLSNAIRNPAIADITGTGFTEGTELKAPRAVTSPNVTGAARVLGVSLDLFSTLPLIQGGIAIYQQGLDNYELNVFQSMHMSDLSSQAVLQYTSNHPDAPGAYQMRCTVLECA